MRYSVCASEEYETVAGLEERPLKPIDVRTSTEAEKLVKEMTSTGKYSSIYIHYQHTDSDCYWNPAVGFEPVGKDWIDYFQNQ
jgi:hypothetical protein